MKGGRGEEWEERWEWVERGSGWRGGVVRSRWEW